MENLKSQFVTVIWTDTVVQNDFPRESPNVIRFFCFIDYLALSLLYCHIFFWYRSLNIVPIQFMGGKGGKASSTGLTPSLKNSRIKDPESPNEAVSACVIRVILLFNHYRTRKTSLQEAWDAQQEVRLFLHAWLCSLGCLSSMFLLFRLGDFSNDFSKTLAAQEKTSNINWHHSYSFLLNFERLASRIVLVPYSWHIVVTCEWLWLRILSDILTMLVEFKHLAIQANLSTQATMRRSVRCSLIRGRRLRGMRRGWLGASHGSEAPPLPRRRLPESPCRRTRGLVWVSTFAGQTEGGPKGD